MVGTGGEDLPSLFLPSLSHASPWLALSQPGSLQVTYVTLSKLETYLTIASRLSFRS